MSISVERYAELKRRLETVTREADRATGRQEQLLKELKSEFGVSTLKEAKALLAKKKRQLEAERAAFDKEVAALEKEYADVLP